MNKNFLIITIDALSKWYIDEIKSNDSFFGRLENNSFCFNNMFSVGPFTEAAVRGYWSGKNPLDGRGYLSETFFEKETIFDTFSEEYYMYFGELIPYMNYDIKVDNKIKRERSECRAFEHLWSSRIKYYVDIYNQGKLHQYDMSKLIFIFDVFFSKYYCAGNEVLEEYNKYKIDREKYIFEVLKNKTESELYRIMTNPLIYACENKHVTCIENQKNHPLLYEESLFIKLAKNKNIELALNNNLNKKSEVESILLGEKNRCIMSNLDLLEQMRDENERLPKLREEIDSFLDWYDDVGKNLTDPFMAYIHNYDFHYPENFMNNRVEQTEKYRNEVNKLTKNLDKINNCKISVSKQLCLQLIENNLNYFWKELKKRNIFENTCVILTADHGISNFMHPIKKSGSRWNYTRTNFNIPFYIVDPIIKKQSNNDYICANKIPEILCQLRNNETKITYKKEEYIVTSWINGVPDLDREVVKMGIRDKYFSITVEGFITQLFSSLNIIGIYNLNKDKDEVDCMDFDEISTDIKFNDLYRNLEKEWYLLINKIRNDKTTDNLVSKKALLIEDYFNVKTEKIKYDKFINDIENKKIIIWGTGERGEKMLKKLPNNTILYEIWDSNKEKEGSSFFGYPINKPDLKKLDGDTVVIICSRYENEMIYEVEKAKYKKYYLFSSIY